METLELVVARYHEDLQWVRRVPKRFRVTVYNKGRDEPALWRRMNQDVSPLPNVGREAHTYLHHIVERYDQLADVTVFAQGKPFDHVPSFHRTMHQLAFHKLAVNGFLWMGFIIDRDDATGSLLFQNWSRNTERRPLAMDRFWRALWDEPAPDQVTFYPSGHFAVTAAQIRRRPRSFYQRALQISAADDDMAHCFERTWDRLFGADGIPAEYRDRAMPVYLRKTRRQSI